MAEKFNVGGVGAEYVELVTEAYLAYVGHRVTCVDKNAGRIEELREGRMPIYEPGLEEFAGRSLRTRRLSFVNSDGLAEVVGRADIVFIAVDTPPGEDGSADLSSVGAVARSIGRALCETRRERPLVVVDKSTVPVGSGNYVSMFIQEGAAEVSAGNGPVGETLDYRVISNPEFLREGNVVVYDSLFPDRIMFGADERDVLDTMRALYEPIIEQSFSTEIDPRSRAAVPFITTDLASAEMIKYAANAFLATKVSFINEIANVCELVAADVTNAAAGIGLDDRIGPRFLSAGIEWGARASPRASRPCAQSPASTTSSRPSSRRRRRAPAQAGDRQASARPPHSEGQARSPARAGLQAQHRRFARGPEPGDSSGPRPPRRPGCGLYDPVAGKAAVAYVSAHLPNFKVAFDPYEALTGAHAAVVLTEWEEIRDLDLE